MTDTAFERLDSISFELSCIIKRLQITSAEIRLSYKGIGSEACADCLDDVAQNYSTVLRKLQHIDPETVADAIKAANKAMGGSY